MIQLMEERDLETVFDMMKDFHEASSYKTEWPLDEEGLLTFLESALERDDLKLFVAKEEDHDPVGALCIALTPLWFSWNKLGAAEVFWWVEEDSRGKGIGGQLFSHFEKWAADNDVDHIMSSAIGTTEDHIPKFYQNRGFKQIQANWLKRI